MFIILTVKSCPYQERVVVGHYVQHVLVQISYIGIGSPEIMHGRDPDAAISLSP